MEPALGKSSPLGQRFPIAGVAVERGRQPEVVQDAVKHLPFDLYTHITTRQDGGSNQGPQCEDSLKPLHRLPLLDPLLGPRIQLWYSSRCRHGHTKGPRNYLGIHDSCSHRLLCHLHALRHGRHSRKLPFVRLPFRQLRRTSHPRIQIPQLLELRW